MSRFFGRSAKKIGMGALSTDDQVKRTAGEPVQALDHDHIDGALLNQRDQGALAWLPDTDMRS